MILVESQGIPSDEPICRYEGGVSGGTNAPTRRTGWNWFVPSAVTLNAMLWDAGFEETKAVYALGINRAFGYGRKREQRGILRAGLSIPSIR